MLFRQASVDVRPPPQPSEPVRFDGDAYPPPKGWNVATRVLRRPMSQKALIEAKQARQKPKEAPTLPELSPSMFEEEPPKRKTAQPLTDGTELEAMYAQNRAEDLARLEAPLLPPDVDAPSRSSSVTEIKGPTLTKKQIDALTSRARKAKDKREGVLKSSCGSGNKITSQGRVTLKTSQQRVRIPSGRDKHRTDERQAIAKRRENKRSLKTVDITDEMRITAATSALKEFHARGVANTQRALVLLIEFLSPTDGSGEEALFAYIIRRMHSEEEKAQAEERALDKKLLFNAAKKAISELTKLVRDMMNDDVCEDVTNDPEMQRRFGAERRRSSRAKDMLQIRQRVMKGVCVLHFLISVKKSGQKTLLGVVIDRP